MDNKLLFFLAVAELVLNGASEKEVKQPDVSVYPSSASLKLGEDFEAVCHLAGVEILDMVNNFPVEWFNGKAQISYLHSISDSIDKNRLSTEIMRSDTGKLESRITIKGVTATDSGRYTCRAGSKNDSVILSVKSSGGQPEVTVTPSGMNLSVGETFKATCHFPGISTLDMVSFYPVQWFKGTNRISFLSSLDEKIRDKRLIISVDVHDANNLSAVLTIKNVSTSDDGLYTCKVGEKSSSTELVIRKDKIAFTAQGLEFLNNIDIDIDMFSRRTENHCDEHQYAFSGSLIFLDVLQTRKSVTVSFQKRIMTWSPLRLLWTHLTIYLIKSCLYTVHRHSVRIIRFRH